RPRCPTRRRSVCGAPSARGQREAHRRALTERAVDVKLATMGLDQMLHDREPEPGPADLPGPVLVDTVEALRDAREVGRWDPDPRVADPNLDTSPWLRSGLDADLSPLGRELDRVVHEVDQDLDEPVAVRVDGEVGRHRTLEH